MFDRHFVALMQIYLTSHAIHQAKDDELVADLRRAYGDINDRYNATIQVGDKTEDPEAMDVYEHAIRERVPLAAVTTVSADDMWDVHGYAGNLSGKEISARTYDDRVPRYCFAAQAIYAAQECGADKDQIAMSVLRGRVSPDLRETLRPYVSTVVKGLRSCPDYDFRVYWGYPEMMHRIHITDPAYFSSCDHSPFSSHAEHSVVNE